MKSVLWIYVWTLPVYRHHGFRRAVQVLFKLQLKGLANGTDYTLG